MLDEKEKNYKNLNMKIMKRVFFCKIKGIFYILKGFLLVIYIKTADTGLNVKDISANIFSHATCLQFKNDCTLFRCLY